MLALSLLIAGANAQQLTWTLEGVTFDDGGTATGAFNRDFTTKMFSAVNITTTPGTTLTTGATYLFLADGFSHNASEVRFVTTEGDNTGLTGLTLFFPDPDTRGLDSPLFATTIYVSDEDEQPDMPDPSEDSNEATCTDFGCGSIDVPLRIVMFGSVGSSEPLFQYMYFGG